MTMRRYVHGREECSQELARRLDQVYMQNEWNPHLPKRTVVASGGITTDELHFFYDSQRHPARISYNGVIHTYVHNVQENIVGIVDNNDTPVIELNFNVWGKPLGATVLPASTLGMKNPFRYRAYIHDEKTELYYFKIGIMISTRVDF